MFTSFRTNPAARNQQTRHYFVIPKTKNGLWPMSPVGIMRVYMSWNERCKMIGVVVFGRCPWFSSRIKLGCGRLSALICLCDELCFVLSVDFVYATPCTMPLMRCCLGPDGSKREGCEICSILANIFKSRWWTRNKKVGKHAQLTCHCLIQVRKLSCDNSLKAWTRLVIIVKDQYFYLVYSNVCPK